MIKSNLKLFILSFLLLISFKPLQSAEMVDPIKVDWSFKGLTGTFDRASLQRGFQVYKEVCASCHSMQYLSYRNLGEPGGPEFSEQEVKAIAASFEIEDGPDAQGECLLDQENLQINLKVRIQMSRQQQQRMVEHIRQICQF